jgi:hypothetical protein
LTCAEQLSRLGGLKWETTMKDIYPAATPNDQQVVKCAQGMPIR